MDTLIRPARLLLIVTLIIASMSVVQAAAPEQPDRIAARNETDVRNAFANWSAGQGSVFDLLSPDIIWTIHGSSPVAGTYNGVEEFLQRGAVPLTSRLARPLVPSLRAVWAVGDTVIIRFDAASTTTGGNPYKNQYVWIFRMQDGAVVEAEAFLDMVAYDKVVAENQPRAHEDNAPGPATPRGSR